MRMLQGTEDWEGDDMEDGFEDATGDDVDEDWNMESFKRDTT